MNQMVITLTLLLLLVAVQVNCHPTRTSEPKFPSEVKSLSDPPLADIAAAMREGLKPYFATVIVNIVKCPDLTKEPYNLITKGIGGSTYFMEVGSESYLTPCANREKLYDFITDIHPVTNLSSASYLGAGSGPIDFLKTTSELQANCMVSNGKMVSGSQVAKVLDDGSYTIQDLSNDVRTFGFMSNFFVSEGMTGEVLNVICKNRTGDIDFASALVLSVEKGFPDESIAMGGAIHIDGSTVQMHVQPNISKTPLCTAEEVNGWLKWYEMSPPMVLLGTFITKDPGLDVRRQHFHGMSNHGVGGHYHIDTQPIDVEYNAILNVAHKLIRIDKPIKKTRCNKYHQCVT